MSFEFNRATVPEDLAALPQWLMWKFEAIKGKVKLGKVPYYCHGAKRTGQQGSEADRKALLTLDAALAQAQKRGANGVGFAFLHNANTGFQSLSRGSLIGTEGKIR
jgi:primase-polymerase (primpol)-like protein